MRNSLMLVLLMLVSSSAAAPWKRHTIDSTSLGADGVRLADVNSDGMLDITTGWEEGGAIRVYVNPGPERAKQPWPSVTVGQVKSPEDAVLVDLDGDGAMDVVSSCEGKTQSMFVHWAPKDATRYLTASAWRTESVPSAVGATRWMFASPARIDDRHGVDLFVSSKSPNGLIGWLESPHNASDLDVWRLHRLYRAGWIMSLIPIDMNGDGQCDVLASDRKGDQAGVLWLEHPGESPSRRSWAEHRVGLDGQQVMFIDACDVNEDARVDVAAAVKPRNISLLLQPIGESAKWAEHTIEFPEKGYGTSKAVRVADLDLDGRLDLVVTCEGADGPRSGVFWMSHSGDSLLRHAADSIVPSPLPAKRNSRGEGRVRGGKPLSVARPATGWAIHDISGPEGTKYDLIQLLDLDQDGDLDILTCEERVNLGVIWYENPVR